MQTYLEQEAIVRRDELEKKNDYIDDVKEYSGEKLRLEKAQVMAVIHTSCQTTR